MSNGPAPHQNMDISISPKPDDGGGTVTDSCCVPSCDVTARFPSNPSQTVRPALRHQRRRARFRRVTGSVGTGFKLFGRGQQYSVSPRKIMGAAACSLPPPPPQDTLTLSRPLSLPRRPYPLPPSPSRPSSPSRPPSLSLPYQT